MGFDDQPGRGVFEPPDPYDLIVADEIGFGDPVIPARVENLGNPGT